MFRNSYTVACRKAALSYIEKFSFYPQNDILIQVTILLCKIDSVLLILLLIL